VPGPWLTFGSEAECGRIWAGYQGRPKTGRVLMCSSCTAEVDEHWRKQEEMQKAIAIAGLVIMAVICLALYAIRGC
jgi:hypothetical protein